MYREGRPNSLLSRTEVDRTVWRSGGAAVILLVTIMLTASPALRAQDDKVSPSPAPSTPAPAVPTAPKRPERVPPTAAGLTGTQTTVNPDGTLDRRDVTVGGQPPAPPTPAAAPEPPNTPKSSATDLPRATVGQAPGDAPAEAPAKPAPPWIIPLSVVIGVFVVMGILRARRAVKP